MEITKSLAENIVRTNYENLPPQVIGKAKRHILDTLGVMFPPTTLEKGCQSLNELAKEAGGKPESTVVGFGGKVPAWMAAFVNGSLCHPMDYDDIIDEYANHPSAQVIPAALAIAERVGNVQGKEFINAVALGIDLNVRLSAAPKGSLLEDYPWFSICIFGVFSATAVAGKLLGLNEQQMVNALGIALDRTSGITESITSADSEIRAIRDSFSNREGVLAALMAQKGISACKDSIEKLYRVYYKNNYESSALLSNLGKDFGIMKVGLKAWPCCRVSHTYVKAALDVATQNNLDPAAIEEITITVGRFGRDVLCCPPEAKQRPKLSINAKMSLPFTMGVVFAKRRVIIEDFFPENLKDPKVLDIAAKVKYELDSQPHESSICPGTVEVKLKGGESLRKRVDIPYGNPKLPMSDKELIDKFKDCAKYANKKLSPERVDQLAQKILELEKVENMREMTKFLE